VAACAAGVILGLFLSLAWSHRSLPALFCVDGQAVPVQRHTMGIGLPWLIKRRPVMIGPITGGFPRDRLGLRPGFRAGVLLSILLGLGALPRQAAACYIPALHLADRYGRKPFVITTLVFFTLFLVVHGLKGSGEPARKSLIIRYAPIDKQGRTIGAYYLVRDTIVTTGSFVGAALWRLSPKANFAGPALLGGIRTRFCIRSLLKQSDTSKQIEFGC